jgi:hypothetical protein
MIQIEFLEGFTVTPAPDVFTIAIHESTLIEFEATLTVDGMAVPLEIRRDSFCVTMPRSEGP